MSGFGGPTFRGDIHGPWEQDRYGERWLNFDRAANELADKLAIPPSAAQAKLIKTQINLHMRSIS
jgi:hypothetical protein